MNDVEMIPAFWLAIPFLLLLLVVNWLGFRFKMHHIRKFPGTEHVGIGPTEGSLLGLTALLLSFTFGMSATKYETRRTILISEVTDIETVISRSDMYPDSVRNLFRNDLKNYLEIRIRYYSAEYNEEVIKSTLKESDSISNKIWQRTAILSRDLNNRVASEQMVPAVNAMIDIAFVREAARNARVPHIVLFVLSILIIVSAFLSGYGSKHMERNKVLVFAFAIMTSLALYLVVDLDRPRQGFVNLNSAEQMMVELRSHFVEHDQHNQ